jgi:hypothetical protein
LLPEMMVRYCLRSSSAKAALLSAIDELDARVVIVVLSLLCLGCLYNCVGSEVVLLVPGDVTR